MSTTNLSDGLLERRDREVLRAASPSIVPASNAGGSPRRRWSPRSGGSSPNRRSRWSPTRWSPSRLSPNSLLRRNGGGKNYEELRVETANSSEDDDPNFKENASPMGAELSMDGIPIPTLESRTYDSPLSGLRSIPSPAPKPRFSLGALRRRDVTVSRPLSTPSRSTVSQQHRQGSTRAESQASSPQDASPIFRFKVHTYADGTQAVLPPGEGSIEDRNERDDFDELVKERQGGVSYDGVQYHPASSSATETNYAPQGSNSSSTDLHHLCASMSTLDDVLRAKSFLVGHVDHAAKIDINGRTPLHVFSSNKIVATAIGVPSAFDTETREFHKIHKQPSHDSESNLEKHLVRFLVGDLLAASPGAILMRDNDSHIPFEGGLIEWVRESHQRGLSNESGGEYPSHFSYTNAVSQVWESTMRIAGRTSMMVSSGFSTIEGTPSRPDLERGDNSRKTFFSPDYRQSYAGGQEDPAPVGSELKDRSFPSFVRLTPQARFILTMLSAVVDQLDRYNTSPQLLRRQMMQRVGPDVNKESFIQAQKGLDEFRNQHGSVNIVATLVQSLASIPDLLKTIILIENDGDRAFALSTSIMRRVMLSKQSVGPWITQILQSRDRRLAQRAVDYLKTVSDELEGAKSVKTFSFQESSNEEGDDGENHDFIDEISHLQGFIPSLLALSDRGIEDASTTFIVKRVLDRMISRPFAVTVILCDAIFLALLIVGFRIAINRVILGASLDSVLQWIYVANTGIFYFIIREIGKTVSLFLISKRTRIYFFSFWNVIDLLAIVLALASTITMRYHFTILENGLENTSFLRGLLAVATGFLWLRVLSLLKAINMQLATFVLAILQITKDILWFCVILVTLVVSFSQMFFTLLAPPSCAATNDNMECKPTEYLLRVYTILLGDFGNFEREQLTTGLSVFLAVFFSFLVTVVLLNVLIAIASDSYEKCLLRSHSLFGRARVMLVAELVSFQNLLKRSKKSHDGPVEVQGLYSRWWTNGRWIKNWSRGSILFFSLSVFLIFGWTIAELMGYANGERHSNILFSLASVFVNVLLFAVIMLFLAGASAKTSMPDGKQPNPDGFVQRAMLHLLGAPHDTNSNQSENGDQYEWNGRVDYLQRQMKSIAEEQRSLAVLQARALENIVSQSESRLQAELEVVEDNFLSLKESLLEEVKGTRRTNQHVTIAVEELRQLISMAAESTICRSPVPSEVNVDRERVISHEQRES